MTVLSVFRQYGVGSRSKKHKFQTKLDIENFRSILFWSENVDSGVKLDTSNLSNSQSNQNDLTHFLIVLLIQFPKTSKSVWSKSKCPNDCFLESDQTEFQYIENWTSSLSWYFRRFWQKGDQIYRTFVLSVDSSRSKA